MGAYVAGLGHIIHPLCSPTQEGYEAALACNGEMLEGRPLRVGKGGGRSGGRQCGAAWRSGQCAVGSRG